MYGRINWDIILPSLGEGKEEDEFERETFNNAITFLFLCDGCRHKLRFLLKLHWLQKLFFFKFLDLDTSSLMVLKLLMIQMIQVKCPLQGFLIWVFKLILCVIMIVERVLSLDSLLSVSFATIIWVRSSFSSYFIHLLC